MEKHPGMVVRDKLVECIREADPPTHVFIMRRFRERYGNLDAPTAEGILRNMVSNGALLIGAGGHLTFPERSDDITG